MRQTRPPLVRMYTIDEMLRSNRYPNCSSLARYFEVSTKTIQRDIDYMRDMFGAPIAYDSRERGFFYEAEWLFLPSAFLEESEAEALKVVKKVLVQYEDTPYYAEVSQALDKVLQYLPETMSDPVSFSSVYSFQQPTTERFSAVHFARIEDGIRQKLKVRIRYDAPSTGEISERVIHPYRLHNVSDAWYVIAYCELRKGMRSFVVRRMKEVTLLAEHYVPDSSIDPDEYVSRMFQRNIGKKEYTVRIHFSQRQSRWMRERTWHDSQSVEEKDDGSLILCMTVSSLDAVRSWVMQYSSEAEVLEPKELRELVKAEALKIAATY
ncbi:MAG: transcriptional regulator [Prosthecochloris sp.]|jgi:predicted DNA-binding transcriptional regulator YafY|nr:transcriptional regulator [Prosthecochloris sp.]